jgi:hypothetical protein
MGLEFSRQIFEEYYNIKLKENPSIGRRVVPCGRAGVTKLAEVFLNFVSLPNRGEV